MWQAAALLLCALFLASIARFYHPRFGFTALIAFLSTLKNPSVNTPKPIKKK